MTNTCCDKCRQEDGSNLVGDDFIVCTNPTCECHGVKDCCPGGGGLHGVHTDTCSKYTLAKPDHPSDEEWEKEFDKELEKLEDIYSDDDGYSKVKLYLKSDKNILCANTIYPETFCELDPDKVKKWIKTHFIHRDSLRREVQEYLGHIQNDGSGKPMNISLEEIGQDLIRLIDQK
jgi:hypothetical protein